MQVPRSAYIRARCYRTWTGSYVGCSRPTGVSRWAI